MKGPAAVPSIEIADGSDLRLGGEVRFVTEGYPRKVHGTLQRVQVQAWQDTCDPSKMSGFSPDPCDGDPPYLTYGEGGASTDTFLLGGSMSVWFAQGGPAHCVATMFYFDNSGPTQLFVPLASVEFDAAG